MLTIQSQSHPYSVEPFDGLDAALVSVSTGGVKCHYLIDQAFADLYADALAEVVATGRVVYVKASEEAKQFDSLSPVFLSLLRLGLKRDGLLVVIGGGVLQDIGCFIASVLFRGLRWALLPTTLLAQADSCIGSKSSINIGPYKNQLGTFYPPHRIMLVASTLHTLPADEIRSGFGEIIKLQLLTGEDGFRELMADCKEVPPRDPSLLHKWVLRSMAVKQPYIEADEFDKGVRNLLNYGHTFGHAYESASHFAIPHGIAVLLGMLTATFVSARVGLVPQEHFEELCGFLMPWCHPYQNILLGLPVESVLTAIRHDKKNTGEVINCILTRGFGRMEKTPVSLADVLAPAITSFIARH